VTARSRASRCIQERSNVNQPKPMSATERASEGTARQLYLDLLKRQLTRAVTEDNDSILGQPNSWAPRSWQRKCGDAAGGLLRRAGLELVRKRPYNPETRELGRDWPARAETMIGLRRLDNIQMAVETVLERQIPGDLVETGVWRGGAAIFMRGILRAHGVTDRTVWAADSFRGLPRPDGERYSADANDDYDYSILAVGVDEVRHNFERYGLLDDQVRFLVGWFKDTLPAAPIEQIAVLRLDGDMYESTTQAIRALYDKLQPGGFCIVDDYGAIKACREAITDFRRHENVDDEIVDIDGWGVYWRKRS
jgi:O-methyltransferase